MESPVILELGTQRGASTKVFLVACRENGGTLVSVDLLDCSQISQASNFIFVQSDSRAVTNIMSKAPILGHGTGTVTAAFRRYADSKTSASATNPHNQIFAVGIQLGLVGIAVLFAMWAIHWRLFYRPGLAAWIGMIAVTQNIVGSLFNSHLTDFTQSWIYVFAVGVFGGAVLRRNKPNKPDDPTPSWQ